jgi:hypothetical protein
VTPEYLSEFINTYDRLFQLYPEELINYRHFSMAMRKTFRKTKRAIPLLHRNGNHYKVSPRNGRLRRVDPGSLPKYGPYLIAEKLPFPGE